ncbi:MAG: hypothetical protein AWM53_02009 [Candidatus Dichloromethanomonas elyunquensis]|nr:MAG: hypothetical protein AWM53_02009 [Candidatus Dichloromethanomonas elyunquensis]
MNAQKALEYRDPQKVVFEPTEGMGKMPKCPRCKAVFITKYGLTSFCGNCGQRLNWRSLLDDLREDEA